MGFSLPTDPTYRDPTPNYLSKTGYSEPLSCTLLELKSEDRIEWLTLKSALGLVLPLGINYLSEAFSVKSALGLELLSAAVLAN